MSAEAHSGVPPAVAQELARLGRVIDPPNTGALYLPLLECEPYEDLLVMRDIAYGVQERQRLDLVQSTRSPTVKHKPVLVFVHGGGFSSGDKHIPGSPFYDNIVVWAARHGFVGVTITYRLTPQFVWPSGVHDVAAAVRWIAANIGRHGGDPSRIYLMGHSAGAVHVAGYLAHPGLNARDGSGIAGAVLVSGLYDLTERSLTPPEQAYFGTEVGCHAERSPLSGLIAQSAPLLLVAAELDPPIFASEFERARALLAKAPRAPARSLLLAHHNHLSQVFSINTTDTILSDAIATFAGVLGAH